MNDVAAISKMSDLLQRLRSSLAWITAQFWATLLIVLAGVGWTRLPDKHAWQVLLSLVIPVLLLVAVLLLEAGTIRRLVSQKQSRAQFVPGALSLLAWIAVAWLAWAILDWCDDQTFLWAGYLNSQAPARARLFTYQHIQVWLTILIWICRWIAIPGKIIPHAVASVQWGWCLPWRKVLRVLLNWRWWAAVVCAALLSVALTTHLFSFEPHGTTTHQVWIVILKLAAAYLLAVASWVLLLAWAVVLIARQPEPAEDALDAAILLRLRMGRAWIAATAAWTILVWSVSWALPHLPNGLGSQAAVSVTVGLLLLALAFVLVAGTFRAMLADETNRVRFVWGVLSVLAWGVLALAAAFLLSLIHSPWWLDALCWIIVPAILIPIASASAAGGMRLPWKRIFAVHWNWLWWLSVLACAVAGIAIPQVLLYTNPEFSESVQNELLFLREFVAGDLGFICWVFLAGLVAALLTRHRNSSLSQPGENAGGNA